MKIFCVNILANVFKHLKISLEIMAVATVMTVTNYLGDETVRY